MPCGYRQACSVLLLDAELLADFNRNQRETFSGDAAHRAYAASLSQVRLPRLLTAIRLKSSDYGLPTLFPISMRMRGETIELRGDS